MKSLTRTILFLTFALCLAMLVPMEAQATTYYVSNSGRDANSGAIAAPWQTLRFAVSRLNAGDTLYIRGGIYTGGSNTIDSALGPVPSGTSWANAITIAGYPNETVTIQHPDSTGGIQLTGSVHSYIIFQDLIVDGINGTDNGLSSIIYISQGANHIRFLRVEVMNSWTSGFNIFSSGGASAFNEVLNCKVHGNGRRPVTNSGYGFYVKAVDTLLDGNEIYQNGGYGVQVVSDRSTIRNNIIRDNGVNHAAPVGDQGGSTSYAIDIGASYEARSDANMVYNNLIYGNRGGILVYSNSTNTGIYNNTIYNNAPAEGVAVQYVGGDVIIRNNIIFSNAAGIVDYGGASGGTIIQDHNLATNPKFVDATAGKFSLQAGSAAIDMGVTVSEVSNDIAGVLRPTGAVYDAGAYEYLVSGAKPSAPQNVRLAP
jgi:parallel beta-helix repeat protein